MFKTIILGGELQRHSFLYRFLAFFRGRERIEGLRDSCGLHGELIVAAIQALFATAVIGVVLWFIILCALEMGLVDALIAVAVIAALVAGAIAIIFAAETWRWVSVVVTTGASAVMIFILAITSLCLGEMLARKMEWITTFAPAIWLGPAWGTLYVGHLIAGLVALILIVAAFIGVLIAGIVGWELVTYAYDEAARTRLYKWLKGHLCFRIEIID